jgi:hemoglobin-like flavoprotein
MHAGNGPRDWLDPSEVASIRRTFAAVAADADRFAQDYYARLFELAPTLQALFPEDLAAQRAKLAQMLATFVSALDRPADFRGMVAALGERHRSYGVVRSDFIVVGRALLDTLGARLGDAFATEDRAAWRMLYARIAAIMTARTAFAAAA